MVKLKIGGDERTFSDIRNIDEQWINQQIRARKQAGESICVRVTITEGGVDVILASANCSGGGGGSARTPTAQEQNVFELWNSIGMKNESYSAGDLISFLNRLRRLIG